MSLFRSAGHGNLSSSASSPISPLPPPSPLSPASPSAIATSCWEALLIAIPRNPSVLPRRINNNHSSNSNNRLLHLQPLPSPPHRVWTPTVPDQRPLATPLLLLLLLPLLPLLLLHPLLRPAATEPQPPLLHRPPRHRRPPPPPPWAQHLCLRTRSGTMFRPTSPVSRTPLLLPLLPLPLPLLPFSPLPPRGLPLPPCRPRQLLPLPRILQRHQ